MSRARRKPSTLKPAGDLTLPEERQPPEPVTGGGGLSLRADCERCFALCCVAPAFSASADFAISKPAGQPCPNLQPDFRCSIHDRLRPRGFGGCTAYDCFGAGQQVAQVTFGGRDWRQAPEIAAQMFDVFGIVRQLHELLWYLTEALTLPPARPLHGELRAALQQTERLAGGSPDALAALDVSAHRRDVNALLLRASELAQAGARRQAVDHGSAARKAVDHSGAGLTGAGYRGAGYRGADHRGADHRGADLTGKDLSGAGLAAASLRGACLIGADLSGADLRGADLTGADLRGADLSGADLTGSIFLTQSQLEAAKGDPGTKLPSSLAYPAHWLPTTAGGQSG
jgi:uncharacterized protein YjbI with pentapeptide repeats